MKRLRELEPDDRLIARAHELIDAVGPTVPSEVRLRRVRRALDQPVGPSRRVWVLRGALALAIAGVGASALAFSGVFSAAPSPQGALTAPAVAPPARHAPARPAMPVAGPAEPNEETVVAPTPRVAPRPRRSEPPGAAVSASDVARIHEAAKALRADGDAARALQLLESSEKVAGPLAEEALALRIEAANASHDPRAKSLAQSYLSRYPAGRYGELARRTLAAR